LRNLITSLPNPNPDPNPNPYPMLSGQVESESEKTGSDPDHCKKGRRYFLSLQVFQYFHTFICLFFYHFYIFFTPLPSNLNYLLYFFPFLHILLYSIYLFRIPLVMFAPQSIAEYIFSRGKGYFPIHTVHPC
jgi:hypothetical protein